METDERSQGSAPEVAPAFGDLLRRYRRAVGLTQEALAERAGLSVRAITALERGVNRAPRRETLQLLATALELSPRERAELEAARISASVRQPVPSFKDPAALVRASPAVRMDDRPGFGSTTPGVSGQTQTQASLQDRAAAPATRLPSGASLPRAPTRVWRSVPVLLAAAVVVIALVVTARASRAPEKKTATSPLIERVVPGWGARAGTFAPMMYPSGVAIDGQGDVFVVDQLRNHVREISPAGVPLGEWGTQGGVPGQLDQPAGLAVDAQDNVYVADSNNDRVQKLSSAGAPLAQWSDLGAAYGRLNQPSDVALDRRGDIFILDAGNGRVVELSPIGNPQAAWRTTGSALAVGRNGEIYVSAGDSGIYRLSPRDSVDAHWGGPGLKPLEFSNAQGIALDRFGNLYVADSGNNRIQELSPTGRFLRQWRTGNDGRFNTPVDVAVDADGNLYVADAGNGRIQKLPGPGAGLRHQIDPAKRPSPFKQPAGVATDGQGNVYVTDAITDRIQVRSPGGQVLTEWGGPGSSPGRLDAPSGIAVDSRGHIYVADTGNNRVQQLTPTGQPLGEWRQFRAPYGVATDARGDVYVADTGNHRIQKLSPRGRLLADIGGPRVLSFPYGLSVDAQGNVYVADELANRIDRFSPHGQLLAAWRAVAPVATAVSAQGIVFVLGGEDGRIREFTSSGNLLATFGGRGSGAGEFSSPSGISVDRQGDLYVTDTNNRRIQKFVPAKPGA